MEVGSLRKGKSKKMEGIWMLTKKRIGEIALLYIKSEKDWVFCCERHEREYMHENIKNEADALGISVKDATEFFVYLMKKKHAKTLSMVLGAEEVSVDITPEMEEAFGEIALRSIKQKLLQEGEKIHLTEVKDQILATSAVLEIYPYEAALFAKEILNFAYAIVVGQIDDLIMDWSDKNPNPEQ